MKILNHYPLRTRVNEIEEEFGRLPNISTAVACPQFEIDGIWYHPFYGDLIGEYPTADRRRFIHQNWRVDEKIVKKLLELGY